MDYDQGALLQKHGLCWRRNGSESYLRSNNLIIIDFTLIAMAVLNYNHGKFFSPSQSYMGYVFIACGIFASYYSLTALFLLIPGVFIAFTYTGTIIDTDKKRVKPYTSHFGLIRTGKWIETNRFSKFNIVKANRRYTNISRGGVRFDMNISDIRLIIQNKDGSRKVVLNVYSKFEDAQREMEELSGILFKSEYTGNKLLNNHN